MKQMAEKRTRTLDKRTADRDNFNSVGIKSSDVYYVNEDAKTAK